jgi:PAS domain S-box-containing protein
MNAPIRLLYTEDNLQDVDLTLAHFEHAAADFSIAVVRTGAESLARLAEQTFDLLLLDNRLPDMDGLVLLADLRSRGYTLPVVMITGMGDEETVAQALRLGAADYISKSEPDYLEALPGILRKIVARHLSTHPEGEISQRVQQILYIEPNTMDMELTVQHFATAAPHLHIHAVSSSADALALLSKDHHYDLILSDLRTPGMNALELMREIRHRDIDLPFIVITGKGDEATAIAILRMGAYDYLVKRNNYLMQLPHTIDNVIKRHNLDQTTRCLNAELRSLNASLEAKVAVRTAEIQATQNEFQTMLNAIPDMLFELDLKGRCYAYHSPRTGTLTKSTRPLANVGIDMLSQSSAESVLAALREADEHDRSMGREYSVSSPHGDSWYELSIAKKVDEGSQPVRFIALSRNITERKRTELEIAQSRRERDSERQLFHAILDNAPVGIWMLGIDDKIKFVNSTFCNAVGVSEQQFQQAGHNSKLLPTTVTANCMKSDQNCYAHDTPVTSLESLPFVDGKEHILEITKAKLYNPDGGIIGLIGLSIDVTERTQAEERLRATSTELAFANAALEAERSSLAIRVSERTAQLQQANKTKDTFLATMSHEIRTPLAGLMGMMELLDNTKLDAQQHELLNTARESANNLLRIVNDILDWSKIEAGKLVLAPQPSSISTLLKGIVNTYANIATAKNVSLRFNCANDLGEAHLFDRLRISQILNNLTSNALKFTEHGSVEIRAERLAQHDSNETVCFSVHDSGIGMTPEQLARVFQQYEQASNETARMYGGTGLGLAISHRLAELMGGALSAESTAGIGSTFSFTIDLPLARLLDRRELQIPIEAQSRRRNKSNVTPLRAREQQINVLIVDDHPVNRMLLKQQLELLGLHLQVAESGSSALSLWLSQHFDLLITDCHMPEMDGYALTRHIREQEQLAGRKRIPIIAWTANVLAEESHRCQAAGMDDILTKPTELAALRDMLVKWLDQ